MYSIIDYLDRVEFGSAVLPVYTKAPHALDSTNTLDEMDPFLLPDTQTQVTYAFDYSNGFVGQ
jgi:hypothetical protein